MTFSPSPLQKKREIFLLRARALGALLVASSLVLPVLSLPAQAQPQPAPAQPPRAQPPRAQPPAEPPPGEPHPEAPPGNPPAPGQAPVQPAPPPGEPLQEPGEGSEAGSEEAAPDSAASDAADAAEEPTGAAGPQSTSLGTAPVAQYDSPPPAPPNVPPGPSPTPVTGEPSDPQKADEWPFKHFFDHMGVRGYSQLRFNQLGATNERLVNVQGDRSMGGTGGFFFRRIRLILYGDVHPLIYAYLQPDFASSPASGTLNFTQLRDWYFDLSEPSKQLRLRVGQSKVPYGFENMQSSQNRLPLDRSDPINSAVANERDIGMFLYFAPTEIRRRFKYLVDSGLKGSGDYGMVGVGIYNGQTANRPEQNLDKHVVARVTYPFVIGNQILETGVAGYTGEFVVNKDPNVLGDDEFRDARLLANFILYPQPLGIQVEYNIGKGPAFQALPPSADPDAPIGVVEEEFLHGGYALVSLQLDDVIPSLRKVGKIMPYVRGMLYEGGKKHELNAPKYSVREIEMGVEWQVVKALELVGAYVFADRTFPEFPFPQEEGSLLRLQLQVNY